MIKTKKDYEIGQKESITESSDPRNSYRKKSFFFFNSGSNNYHEHFLTDFVFSNSLLS